MNSHPLLPPLPTEVYQDTRSAMLVREISRTRQTPSTNGRASERASTVAETYRRAPRAANLIHRTVVPPLLSNDRKKDILEITPRRFLVLSHDSPRRVPHPPCATFRIFHHRDLPEPDQSRIRGGQLMDGIARKENSIVHDSRTLSRDLPKNTQEPDVSFT